MRVGEERVYTLAYVDDLVLIAENEDKSRSLIERLITYLDERT